MRCGALALNERCRIHCMQRSVAGKYYPSAEGENWGIQNDYQGGAGFGLIGENLRQAQGRKSKGNFFRVLRDCRSVSETGI